jgi:hypothetical protein
VEVEGCSDLNIIRIHSVANVAMVLADVLEGSEDAVEEFIKLRLQVFVTDLGIFFL